MAESKENVQAELRTKSDAPSEYTVKSHPAVKWEREYSCDEHEKSSEQKHDY